MGCSILRNPDLFITRNGSFQINQVAKTPIVSTYCSNRAMRETPTILLSG